MVLGLDGFGRLRCCWRSPLKPPTFAVQPQDWQQSTEAIVRPSPSLRQVDRERWQNLSKPAWEMGSVKAPALLPPPAPRRSGHPPLSHGVLHPGYFQAAEQEFPDHEGGEQSGGRNQRDLNFRYCYTTKQRHTRMSTGLFIWQEGKKTIYIYTTSNPGLCVKAVLVPKVLPSHSHLAGRLVKSQGESKEDAVPSETSGFGFGGVGAHPSSAPSSVLLWELGKSFNPIYLLLSQGKKS